MQCVCQIFSENFQLEGLAVLRKVDIHNQYKKYRNSKYVLYIVEISYFENITQNIDSQIHYKLKR